MTLKNKPASATQANFRPRINALFPDPNLTCYRDRSVSLKQHYAYNLFIPEYLTKKKNRSKFCIVGVVLDVPLTNNCGQKICVNTQQLHDQFDCLPLNDHFKLSVGMKMCELSRMSRNVGMIVPDSCNYIETH